MAEVLLPYALTTVQRVKDRLGITVTNFDTVLTRMINSLTDFVERETGGRRFALTQYTAEIYSAYGPRQRFLPVRNAPVTFITLICNTTIGSNSISVTGATINGVTVTDFTKVGIAFGQVVRGDGIAGTAGNSPYGTTIFAVASNSITLSSPATATLTGAVIQITGIIKFQWRSGTPSNPSWTDFIVDQFELVNDGKAGMIRVYGVLPRLYNNMMRVTYTAGYLINFANAGDNLTHTLPADLSDLVENLVVRRFKRRELAGKQSEGLEGAQTNWKDQLDADDKDVLGHYQRAPSVY